MSGSEASVRHDRAVQQSASRSPTTSSAARHVQLKKSVRGAEGYEAQAALLSPVQMLFGLPAMGWFGAGGTKKDGEGRQPPAADKRAAPSEQGLADAAADDGAAVPEMPREFGSESVLRVWIGEFNKSLAKRGQSKLDALIAKGWADANGLSYELLAAAAAKEPEDADPAQKDPAAGQQGAPSGPLLNVRILKMLSRGNGALFNVITPDYAGKCMQFSEKLMKEMGAKRADGTTNEKRDANGKVTALTATCRGKRIKELPKDLPAGYQICVTSRPDWGFTEVGNHWFISAGGGYYLDNVMGVTNGQQLEDSLIKATGDQWGRRVVDKGLSGLRAKMGQQFTDANPSFREYKDSGRAKAEQDKKVKGAANPEYKDASAKETEGLAAVKQFVIANRGVYAPKIWIVEPTTKAAGA